MKFILNDLSESLKLIMSNQTYKNLKSYRQATALRNLFQQERLKKERDFDCYLEDQLKQNKTDKPDKPGRVRLISLIGLIGLISLISLIAPQAVFAFTITTPPNSLTLSSGRVGWWTFDGKNTNWATGITQDISGSGNNGQMIGMSTTTSPVAGKIGQALYFNGTNNYVKIPYNSSFNSFPFTVSAWIKIPVTNNNVTYSGLVGNYTVGSFNGWMFGIGNNQVQFWDYRDSSNNIPISVITATHYNDNKWHFAVVTVTSSGAIIYIDNVSKVSGGWTGTAGSTTTTQPLQIANYGGNYGNATIDDVHVYNRALSAGEVQQLYNIGSATHIDVPPALGQTTNCSSGLSCGLVGYWTFDGKNTNWTTGVTADISGNGNNGQMIGMSTTTSPVAGKIGQALSFNGSSSYVTTGKYLSAFMSTATGTISVWFNAKSPGNNICSFSGTSDNSNFFMDGPPNGEYMQFGLDSSSKVCATIYPNTLITSSPVSLNKWHFAAWVHGNSLLSLYVDGVLIAKKSSPLGPIGTGLTNYGMIGTSAYDAQQYNGLPNDKTGYFKGQIDDVIILNLSLDEEQVYALWQAMK